MAGLVQLAWQRYLAQLENEPLRTKALTAALLAGTSDVIAQRLTTSLPLNWRRTLTLALYGLCWSGPSNHVWQSLLERLFPNRADPLRAVKKVAFDQLSYGPLNNTLLLLYVALFVDGRSLAGALARWRVLYPAVQLKGWRLWPAAQLVNQQFVPLHLRVLFTNLVSLAWSTFLIMSARPAGLPRLGWRAQKQRLG